MRGKVNEAEWGGGMNESGISGDELLWYASLTRHPKKFSKAVSEEVGCC